MQEIAIKYHSSHRKQRYELVEEPKKQVNRVFIDKKIAMEVLMDCRTVSAHKFRTRLGFKQYDVILTQELIILTKILILFERKNMQAQYKF